MKRAEPLIVGSALLQCNEIRHHIYDIGSILDSFYGPAVYHVYRAKAVPASAMRTRSLIAERSLTYAKAAQASAMGTRSLIAERSLTYAKRLQF